MAEGQSTHPAVDLDETVHQRVRLGVLAILVEADRANFTYLRDTLEVTDGNLSAHLNVLANAGLVQLDKRFVEGRPRTWVHATPKGRTTFREEVDALSRLVARYRASAKA
jgi:DNA-binding MarR family transcriptional regulator